MAVPYDGRPPPGEANPSLTLYRGFAVDLARAVARSLDVAIRFAPSSADAVARLPGSSSIHISFPLRSATARLARRSTLTRPYLVTHRRTLVERTTRGGPEAGRRCLIRELGGSGAGVAGRGVVIASAARCGRLLVERRVGAVVGADVVLARLAYDSRRDWVVTGRRVDPKPLSAVVPRGETAFAALVSRVFAATVDSGVWSRSYEKWIGRFSTGPSAPPPAPIRRRLHE